MTILLLTIYLEFVVRNITILNKIILNFNKLNITNIDQLKRLKMQ